MNNDYCLQSYRNNYQGEGAGEELAQETARKLARETARKLPREPTNCIGIRKHESIK